MSFDRVPDHWLYRLLREPVNSLTHLVGALLAVAGLVVLVVLSRGDPWRVVTFTVYGTSLVLSFSASALLHGLHVGQRGQRVLRTLDHAAIFLLIAGTYTPVTLITLRAYDPAWAWSLFAVVWLLALAGVLFKLFWLGAPRWLSTGIYLLLGWLVMIAIVPLVRALPPGGLAWLAVGGLFYSVGAVIYATRKPDLMPKVFGYHELWHLFVLAGSASHFVMMLLYVLPR